MKKFIKLLRRIHSAYVHHKAVAAVLFVLLAALVIFYARQIMSAISVLVLLIVASFSTVYKRKMGMPLGGIELITFGTVLVAVAFGPVAGLLFGIVSSLASEIISQNIGPLTWMGVMTTGLAGLLAGYFSYLNLVLLGTAATVFQLLIGQVVYLFIGDEDVKAMAAFYIVANLVFNIIIFSTLGSRVLALLTF